jgi:hypothetical protein
MAQGFIEVFSGSVRVENQRFMDAEGVDRLSQDLGALARREPAPKGRLKAVAGKRRRTVGFEDHHPTGMTTASGPPSERGVDGIRSAGHPNTKAIVGRIVREQKMIVKR